MAKYFVRNLQPITLSAGYGPNAVIHILRHMFWWADWTEVALDADAAWAAAISISDPTGSPGFRVYAAQPLVVEDLDGTGRFTASMATNSHIIFLKGTGQNRIVSRITRFIDARHVEIAAESAPPQGWADEGGVTPIPGMVIGGNTTGTTSFNSMTCVVATSKSVRLQAPSGNLQIRVVYSASSTMQMFARPKGGAGTATEIGATTSFVTSSDTIVRLHAVFEGRNGLVYMGANQAPAQSFYALFGELDSVDAGDTDPGFLLAGRDMSTYTPNGYPMYMLDGNPTPASILAYPIFVKRQTGTGYASRNVMLTGFRLLGGRPGKAMLRAPWVVLNDVANYGACVRGKLPLMRMTHSDFERWRPMDAAGSWLHLTNGLIVPRNGPNDTLPII